MTEILKKQLTIYEKKKKGIAKAVKKAGRIAAEGLIFDGVTVDHKKAVVLEFNSKQTS